MIHQITLLYLWRRYQLIYHSNLKFKWLKQCFTAILYLLENYSLWCSIMQNCWKQRVQRKLNVGISLFVESVCLAGCPDRYIMYYREGTINQFSQRDSLQNFYYNFLAILAVLFSNILFPVVDIIIYCSYWSFSKSLILVQDYFLRIFLKN